LHGPREPIRHVLPDDLVYDCDLDHREPYAVGGATDIDNLAPLCRHHHTTKHHAPWRVERLPEGDHVWVSPLGHEYLSERVRAGPIP
jgi:hypothetical protein